MLFIGEDGILVDLLINPTMHHFGEDGILELLHFGEDGILELLHFGEDGARGFKPRDGRTGEQQLQMDVQLQEQENCVKEVMYKMDLLEDMEQMGNHVCKYMEQE